MSFSTSQAETVGKDKNPHKTHTPKRRKAPTGSRGTFFIKNQSTYYLSTIAVRIKCEAQGETQCVLERVVLAQGGEVGKVKREEAVLYAQAKVARICDCLWKHFPRKGLRGQRRGRCTNIRHPWRGSALAIPLRIRLQHRQSWKTYR